MVEKIEGGNAEMQVAIASKAEASLYRQICVEESRTLRIGQNILTVLSAIDARKAEASAVDELVRGKSQFRIAGQHRLQAYIRRPQENLGIYGQHRLRGSSNKSVEIKVWARAAYPRLHVATALNAGDARDQPVINNRP